MAICADVELTMFVRFSNVLQTFRNGHNICKCIFFKSVFFWQKIISLTLLVLHEVLNRDVYLINMLTHITFRTG